MSLSFFDEYTREILGPDGKPCREMAQGYVGIVAFDPATRKTIKRWVMKNTVVDDARRSAAAQFSGLPGNIGVGFTVEQYRLGFSDVFNQHWDNDKPEEVPFDDNTPLPEFIPTGGSPSGFSPAAFGFFHTQAHKNGVDGKHFVGFDDPLVDAPIDLGIDYPFNGDEFAVRLFIELDSTHSTLATFDTVEIIMENGAMFAKRFTFPIEKQPNWGLFIEHLILF